MGKQSGQKNEYTRKWVWGMSLLMKLLLRYERAFVMMSDKTEEGLDLENKKLFKKNPETEK
jgi:hypothetical protein